MPVSPYPITYPRFKTAFKMLLDEYNVSLAHSNPPTLQKLIGLKFIHNCISTLANSLFRRSNNSKVSELSYLCTSPVDHFVYYTVEMSEDRDRESDTTIEYPLEDEDMGERREETNTMSREEPTSNKKKRRREKRQGAERQTQRESLQGMDPLEVGKVLQVAAVLETS